MFSSTEISILFVRRDHQKKNSYESVDEKSDFVPKNDEKNNLVHKGLKKRKFPNCILTL